MAVNRYRHHMVIFLEDQPYRELVNGAQITGVLNNSVIDVKNPCGGWKKVFESFKKIYAFWKNIQTVIYYC